MSQPPGRLVIAVVLVGVCAAASAETAGWWNADWPVRRVLKAEVPPGVEADEPLAVAKFLTHGYLTADGRDVRVVARGKEVPCRVLHVGPGDQVTVAFQLLVGVDTYQVYWGNPKAKTEPVTWNIRAGVMLEVKKYTGGSFNNLAEALASWQRPGDVLGVDFVGNIYSGHNPFGPSTGFMARYTGWLNVREAGRYEFFTTSSNGSFLLIDGRPVVTWPGWHGPVPRARFGGSIDLKSGRYKLEYYHIHPSGDPTAVAAWQPPGTQRPVVIPPHAFLPVTRAVVQPAQLARSEVTPDFDYKRTEAFLEPNRDRFLYRFAFRDITDGITPRYYRPLWDFGDGNTATVWTPDHVYLTPGTYTVTYELKGPRDSATTKQRIVVERDWSQQASETNLDELAKYYDTVRTYDFAKMSPAAVQAACEMFDRLKKTDELVRAERVLLFEIGNVPGEVMTAEAGRLAEVYLAKRRDAKSAAGTYLEVEKRVTSGDDKAGLAARAAAVTLEHLADVGAAGECLNRALAYRDVKPETRRRVLMGLAEVAIFRGDAAEARKRLTEADAISVRRAEQGSDAVRVGSLSRAVEDYIRRDEFDAAVELLDTWEWEYPLDRLVGYSTLLRARLHIRREEYPRAIALLESLVKVNPKSNYAAEALMTAAECRLKSGDKERARDTYKRVLGEYPESPLVREALKAFEGLKP